MKSYVWIVSMAAATLLLSSPGMAQTAGGETVRGAARLAEANERHPEMHKALFHLRESKRELEKSAHDYDGHRVAALKCTEHAIQEVVEGLKSDKAVIPAAAEANSRLGGAGRLAEANEHHPEMRRALFHLRESKRELEKSAHDYDGHRVAAIKDAEQAIQEVVDGLKGDGKALAPGAEATSRPGEGRRAEAAERHPEMRRALFHLRESKRELEKSAHDFDGHRVAALKDTDQAIKEVVDGLKDDGKALIPAAASIAEPASRPAEGRRAEVAERHPEMHRAMFHLREAKRELEKSAHDYEGHRVAAIKDAEQAIQEITDGLKSDKT